MGRKVQLILIQENAISLHFDRSIKVGGAFWVSEEFAEPLVRGNIARWPKIIGPSELKPTGPSEVKSFGGVMDGHVTASLQSTPRGPEKLSSASAGVLVPPRRL